MKKPALIGLLFCFTLNYAQTKQQKVKQLIA